MKYIKKFNESAANQIEEIDSDAYEKYFFNYTHIKFDNIDKSIISILDKNSITYEIVNIEQTDGLVINFNKFIINNRFYVHYTFTIFKNSDDYYLVKFKTKLVNLNYEHKYYLIDQSDGLKQFIDIVVDHNKTRSKFKI